MRPVFALAFAACTPDQEPADDHPADTDDIDDTGGTTSVPPTETVRASRFDAVAEILENELGDQVFATGVSIAVLEQGELTWVEGFGSANPESDQLITPDTAFQIGSTTKQMTAALVLSQLERGALALDDTVADLLPNVSLANDPSWAEAATLELLLSHQGGVVDFLDWPGPADDDALRIWHETFFSTELWANNPPGAFWNYSNPNFTVAGLAAETHDAAGRMYADMLVEDLFAPLGMTHTVARKDEVVRPYALSTGLDVENYNVGPLTMDDVEDAASVRPAGLVWSTPADMTRWGSFLVHGEPAVLSDDLRGRLTTPEVSTLYLEEHIQYGLGVFVWDRYLSPNGVMVPLTIWEHGGNTLSMTSAFYVLPDQDVVISILSNGYGDSFLDTIDAVLRVVVTPFPAPTNDFPVVNPEVFAAHVGSYLDPYNVGPIEVTAGGFYGLQIEMPDLEEIGVFVAPDLIPVTNEFWYAELGQEVLEITFVSDPKGGPTPWIRNRQFVGARVTDDAVARAVPIARNGPPVLTPTLPPTHLPRPRPR